MTRFRREGTKLTYIVLGILAFLLALTFLSLYLFGSWKAKSQPDKPQSSGIHRLVTGPWSQAA
jgi:hypothetical protein